MKTISKKEVKRLSDDLLSVCLIYSDFKNGKRKESFGKSMFERLSLNINFNTLYENDIIYKGAQWGGKWGNFYKAIYYKNSEFHYGCGFTNKQILGL